MGFRALRARERGHPRFPLSVIWIVTRTLKGVGEFPEPLSNTIRACTRERVSRPTRRASLGICAHHSRVADVECRRRLWHRQPRISRFIDQYRAPARTRVMCAEFPLFMNSRNSGSAISRPVSRIHVYAREAVVQRPGNFPTGPNYTTRAGLGQLI